MRKIVLLLAVSACGGGDIRDAERSFAVVQSVRPGVGVVAGGDERPLAGRRRLGRDDRVKTDETGRAAVVLDSGARLLLASRADLAIRPDGALLAAGRAWIDVPEGADARLETELGSITARGAGIAVEVSRGRTSLHVAQGEALLVHGRERSLVREGQSAVVSARGARIGNARLWDDWTGGLAVSGPREETAEGVGEIMARLPGSLGEPRWPLVIRNLDVRVRIAGDLAVTEVDQTFFNPASETVEGLYRIRTPEGALLQRFAVDRDGQLVESIVKEQALARQQYQAQVYAGSTEDPALLEWEAPDLYRARIYPIEAGASRRIVIRYAEWIGRAGDVRTYRYPIGRGPRMQEASIDVDVSDAGAQRLRAGLGARILGDHVVLYRSDFEPSADFYLDLYGKDLAPTTARAFRARHVAPVSTETQPDTDESDYLFTQIFPLPERLETPESLDVVLLVDLSAGTDATRIELARQLVESVLLSLEERDHVAVVAADLGMHGIGGAPGRLEPATAARKEAILDALARASAGGATDLGAALSDAAGLLAADRPGAVVYVGDAIPTVGELDLPALRARLARLPRPPRLYGIAVGSEARLDLLEGLVRGGGLAMRVEGRKEAAEAAVRLLSHLSRPILTDVTVSLGQGIDRIYPRTAVSVVAGEPLDVVGRVRGEIAKEAVVRGRSGGRPFETTITLRTETLDDSGDLRLRWASERLRQLLAEGGGREAIAEVGTRYGLLTPFTSFYVPSRTDLQNDPNLQRLLDLRRMEEERRHEPGASLAPFPPSAYAYGCGRAEAPGHEAPATEETPEWLRQPRQDADEGGEGRRHRGEEGQMGAAESKRSDNRYGIQGPADSPAPEAQTAPAGAAPAQDPHMARAQAGEQAGSAGVLGTVGGSTGAWNQPGSPYGRDTALGSDAEDALGGLMGNQLGENFGYGGLGLRGTGRGGGGSGEGTIGLGNLNTIGRGGGGGTGSGYGRGAGGLLGRTNRVPTVRPGAAEVRGALSKEVVRRVVRSHINEVTFCYEQQLFQRPDLEGRVSLQWIVSPTGTVQSSSMAGSTLGNATAEQCMVRAVRRWAFPAPAGGGIVVVTYPFMLQSANEAPDEEVAQPEPPPPEPEPEPEPPPPPAVPASVVVIATGETPHETSRCSPASRQPLFARVALWRERLQATPGLEGALDVWRRTRRTCEIPAWRDRRALLSLLLGAVGDARQQVALHRAFAGDSGIQAYLRREILGRVRSAEDLRIVHAGLGEAGGVDWEAVENLLGKAPDLRTKVGVARDLLRRWPDDLRLAVRLFGLFEEAGEDREARRLAFQIQKDEYADARARTLVGEYWLRKGDEAAAKRAWSEIVEFAPFDPYARRWLGDLYRAAGWYDDAYRQYQTLATLSPDDAGVAILLAAAAAGAGRVDEALRLEGRLASASEPGTAEGEARIALLWSDVRLAAMRMEARRTNDATRLAKLVSRARTTGVLREAAPFRAFLTWSHPDAGIELWTSFPNGPLARPEDLGGTYGIESWGVDRVFPGAMKVEVRQTGDPGLRQVKADLWLVWNEGAENERIEKVELTFGKSSRAAAFTIADGRSARTASAWTPEAARVTAP